MTHRPALLPLCGLCALAGLALLAPAAEAQRILNPDLYRKSVEAAAQAVKQYGLVEDEEQIERVNRIGYQLASRSDFDKYPFSFAIVDISIPNAFALPAGQIFVTRGLLDLRLTDDELASLLGHEIAHVTEQHFLRTRRKATLLNALSQLLTIGVIAAQSSSRDDVYQGPGGLWQRDSSATADLLQGAQATGVVVSELLLRSYSRDHEDESDEVGQRLAAGAGYDPEGAARLMSKMETMIPQTKAFGYWQTHPFFDDRVRAAQARAANLRALEPPADADVARFRAATQETLLSALDIDKLTDRARSSIEWAALRAWPRGTEADRLRLERLQRLRDAEMEKLPLSRDYGMLLAEYLSEAAEIRGYDGKSPALSQLSSEMTALRQELDELRPRALEVLDGGVYETSFLESFASNYPRSDRASEVDLALGLVYSRLGRESEAVEKFLAVWERAPESDEAAQAARGLRNLAPILTQLEALEALARQERDEELAATAADRLAGLASRYETMANGAAYVARFPDGDDIETISERLNELAEAAYREMVLYQRIGDAAKAIERADQILEHAPLSPAAERLGRQLEEGTITG